MWLCVYLHTQVDNLLLNYIEIIFILIISKGLNEQHALTKKEKLPYDVQIGTFIHVFTWLQPMTWNTYNW
jgi:hypothetical protein